MTKRVIQHEVKLEKSVKIIFAALAFGVLAHAFVPAFSVRSAVAEAIKGTLSVSLSGPVQLSGKLGLGGAVKCKGCIPPVLGASGGGKRR